MEGMRKKRIKMRKRGEEKRGGGKRRVGREKEDEKER